MKERKTKEQIKAAESRYTNDIYPHGGSRCFIDGEAGERCLLVDTYYDKEFAEYINKCVKKYFNIQP